MNCQNVETLENFIINSMQYINYSAKKKKDKMSKTITCFIFFSFQVHCKHLFYVLSSFKFTLTTYLSISILKISTVKELGGNILFLIADNGLSICFFFLFFMRNTFKSNQQLLQKYLSGILRLVQLEIPQLLESRRNVLPICGSKMAKVIIFQVFTLVIVKVT